MTVVIDASVTLPWYFDDEASPATDAVMDRVVASGAIVPAHWKLEIASGFSVAIRRGRIDRDYRELSLADLETMPIQTDPETSIQAWTATILLADRYGLTPYDAAYLELAQRRQLALATLDRALRQAAALAGVELV
jgi:predicted nucleic acid-binding protein